MKKEDLKEKLKQEIESEASALERRVNTKKSLSSLEMPEDSYEELMGRIRTKKEQEASSEASSKIKIMSIQKKALATVATIAVLVVGTGLGVNGARLYVLKSRDRVQDKRVDIAADTEEIAYFELTEEEAYDKIEEEIGILALRLTDKPKDINLEKVYVSTDLGEAIMEFSYNGHALIIYENKQIANASVNAQQDGTIVDAVEVFHLGETLDVMEVDKGNGELSYAVQLEYGNAFYYVSSDLELRELENILHGIIFKNV